LIYRIVHRTRYVYHAPVTFCHNEVRLLPREVPHQICRRARLMVDPPPAALRERLDFFGNRVSYFAVQQPHDELTVTASSEVSIQDHAPPDPDASPAWETVRDALAGRTDPEATEARQFVFDSPLVSASAALRDYALPSFPPGRPVLAAARDLMERIFREFEFVPGFTSVATPLSHVLKHRRGVCQDFAHVAVGALRALGLAGRYVSGYLETLPPPGRTKLQGADVSHAWYSVWSPGTGWTDFDPTNNLIPENRHVVTARGRDYLDVAPVKGVLFSGGGHDLTVSVDVERIGE
jgi:transglutaminase-like putative cysteine protease